MWRRGDVVALRELWGGRVWKARPCIVVHDWPDQLALFLPEDGWYVNLERPLERSAVGFDYLDLELDIHVRPDRSWAFLDEDEFEEAQRRGVIAPAEAEAVEAEARRVVERIEAWASPFCDGWEDWLPDPAWRIPSLHRGWDVVCASGTRRSRAV